VREQPQCSIVIPAYNCAPYIAQTITSVLDQTFGARNVEAIVLDDGSSDDTAKIVKSFGDAVRFIQLEHGGVARARNTGIQAARAPYVAFLDADDYWLPHFLQKTFERLQREDRIFVNTETYVDRDGVLDSVPSYRCRGLECLFELSASAQMDFALEDNFISGEGVVPRAALLEAGGYNPRLRYGEDWDLWLRLLKMGYAVRFVKEPCRVVRYMRPGSSRSRKTVAMAKDRIFVLSQYRDLVSPYRWQSSHAMARRRALVGFVRRFIPKR
jgi:glycosyltransferase involved in cell wall biosynthesis